MEQRLIDANALKKAVNGRSTHWLNDWSALGVLAVIDEQPTVDAVPVVRCGECEYHGEPHRTDMGVDVVWCNFYNTHKLKDGYCNCGERKDGERRTE